MLRKRIIEKRKAKFLVSEPKEEGPGGGGAGKCGIRGMGEQVSSGKEERLSYRKLEKDGQRTNTHHIA